MAVAVSAEQQADTSSVHRTSSGGYKESGWGREMGHEVLENYLETKSVVTAL